MLTAAMVFNLLHLMYHQFTIHFDVYPFNNIEKIKPKIRTIKSLACGILMLFPLIALRTKNFLLIEISAVILFLILVKEIIDWWIPYLFGASKEWKNHYLKIFAETTIMLSAIRDNPIPNLEHCILHTLTLLSFLFIIVYYLIIYMP